MKTNKQNIFTLFVLLVIFGSSSFAQETKYKPVVLKKYDPELLGKPLEIYISSSSYTSTSTRTEYNGRDFKQTTTSQQKSSSKSYLLFTGTNKILDFNNKKLTDQYIKDYPEAIKSYKSIRTTTITAGLLTLGSLALAITYIAKMYGDNPAPNAFIYMSIGGFASSYLVGNVLVQGPMLKSFVKTYNAEIAKTKSITENKTDNKTE